MTVTSDHDLEQGTSAPSMNNNMQTRKVSMATVITRESTDITPESLSESGIGNPHGDAVENDVLLTEEELRQRRRSCRIKIAVAALLVAFVVFVIVDSQTNQHVRNGITAFLAWIEENPGAGVVAFMLVYFVATVVFVPGSILTLGAGFVFSASFGSLGIGILLGTISVFFGASAGATVSFLLGRYLLRDSVGRLSKKYSVFEALDRALAEKGLRIMVLLRLSPVIPFNAINYVAGVTAISFWSYVLALIAIIPGTVLYVFLGASAGSLADSASSSDSMTVTIIVVVVGVIFGVLAVALTSYYARKELNRVVADRQAEIEEEHRQHEEDDNPEIPQEDDAATAAETAKELEVKDRDSQR